MRRVALMLGFALLLWACTGGAVLTTTTTTAPTSTTTRSPTSSTTVSSTTTSAALEWPEILVANQDGVFHVDAAGEVSQLVIGRVAYAVDDTRGGLLFQVERGRSRAWWGDGSLVKDTREWWVPRGAGEAQALLVPTSDSRLDLSLLDSVSVDDRPVVMYARHDSTIDPGVGQLSWVDTLRVFDLDTGEVTELFTFPPFEHSYEFSTGGGLILVDEEGVGGVRCYFADATLSAEVSVPVVPQFEGSWELDDHCRWRCVLSTDGTALAYVDGNNASVEDQSVKVVDISSGEVTVEVPGTAASLDLGDGFLLVNYEAGQSIIVSLANPTQYHDVPVSGTARFVTAPIDIAAPVTPPTPASMQLRADGLGVVDFGDPVDEVMAVLTDMLGPPDWEEVQISADTDLSVRWGKDGEELLYLQFTYWDYFDAALEPTGPMPEGPVFHYYLTKSELLSTEARVTVGSTVSDLKTAYRDVRFGRDCPGSDQWLFAVDPPAGWLQLGIFGLLDGEVDDPTTGIVYLGAGWDRTPC